MKFTTRDIYIHYGAAHGLPKDWMPVSKFTSKCGGKTILRL